MSSPRDVELCPARAKLDWSQSQYSQVQYADFSSIQETQYEPAKYFQQSESEKEDDDAAVDEAGEDFDAQDDPRDESHHVSQDEARPEPTPTKPKEEVEPEDRVTSPTSPLSSPSKAAGKKGKKSKKGKAKTTEPEPEPEAVPEIREEAETKEEPEDEWSPPKKKDKKKKGKGKEPEKEPEKEKEKVQEAPKGKKSKKGKGKNDKSPKSSSKVVASDHPTSPLSPAMDGAAEDGAAGADEATPDAPPQDDQPKAEERTEPAAETAEVGQSKEVEAATDTASPESEVAETAITAAPEAATTEAKEVTSENANEEPTPAPQSDSQASGVDASPAAESVVESVAEATLEMSEELASVSAPTTEIEVAAESAPEPIAGPALEPVAEPAPVEELAAVSAPIAEVETTAKTDTDAIEEVKPATESVVETDTAAEVAPESVEQTVAAQAPAAEVDAVVEPVTEPESTPAPIEAEAAEDIPEIEPTVAAIKVEDKVEVKSETEGMAEAIDESVVEMEAEKQEAAEVSEADPSAEEEQGDSMQQSESAVEVSTNEDSVSTPAPAAIEIETVTEAGEVEKAKPVVADVTADASEVLVTEVVSGATPEVATEITVEDVPEVIAEATNIEETSIIDTPAEELSTLEPVSEVELDEEVALEAKADVEQTEVETTAVPAVVEGVASVEDSPAPRQETKTEAVSAASEPDLQEADGAAPSVPQPEVEPAIAESNDEEPIAPVVVATFVEDVDDVPSALEPTGGDTEPEQKPVIDTTMVSVETSAEPAVEVAEVETETAVDDSGTSAEEAPTAEAATFLKGESKVADETAAMESAPADVTTAVDEETASSESVIDSAQVTALEKPAKVLDDVVAGENDAPEAALKSEEATASESTAGSEAAHTAQETGAPEPSPETSASEPEAEPDSSSVREAGDTSAPNELPAIASPEPGAESLISPTVVEAIVEKSASEPTEPEGPELIVQEEDCPLLETTEATLDPVEHEEMATGVVEPTPETAAPELEDDEPALIVEGSSEESQVDPAEEVKAETPPEVIEGPASEEPAEASKADAITEVEVIAEEPLDKSIAEDVEEIHAEPGVDMNEVPLVVEEPIEQSQPGPVESAEAVEADSSETAVAVSEEVVASDDAISEIIDGPFTRDSETHEVAVSVEEEVEPTASEEITPAAVDAEAPAEPESIAAEPEFAQTVETVAIDAEERVEADEKADNAAVEVEDSETTEGKATDASDVEPAVADPLSTSTRTPDTADISDETLAAVPEQSAEPSKPEAKGVPAVPIDAGLEAKTKELEASAIAVDSTEPDVVQAPVSCDSTQELSAPAEDDANETSPGVEETSSSSREDDVATELVSEEVVQEAVDDESTAQTVPITSELNEEALADVGGEAAEDPEPVPASESFENEVLNAVETKEEPLAELEPVSDPVSEEQAILDPPEEITEAVPDTAEPASEEEKKELPIKAPVEEADEATDVPRSRSADEDQAALPTVVEDPKEDESKETAEPTPSDEKVAEKSVTGEEHPALLDTPREGANEDAEEEAEAEYISEPTNSDLQSHDLPITVLESTNDTPTEHDISVPVIKELDGPVCEELATEQVASIHDLAQNTIPKSLEEAIVDVAGTDEVGQAQGKAVVPEDTKEPGELVSDAQDNAVDDMKIPEATSAVENAPGEAAQDVPMGETSVEMAEEDSVVKLDSEDVPQTIEEAVVEASEIEAHDSTLVKASVVQAAEDSAESLATGLPEVAVDVPTTDAHASEQLMAIGPQESHKAPEAIPTAAELTNDVSQMEEQVVVQQSFLEPSSPPLDVVGIDQKPTVSLDLNEETVERRHPVGDDVAPVDEVPESHTNKLSQEEVLTEEAVNINQETAVAAQQDTPAFEPETLAGEANTGETILEEAVVGASIDRDTVNNVGVELVEGLIGESDLPNVPEASTADLVEAASSAASHEASSPGEPKAVETSVSQLPEEPVAHEAIVPEEPAAPENVSAAEVITQAAVLHEVAKEEVDGSRGLPVENINLLEPVLVEASRAEDISSDEITSTEEAPPEVPLDFGSQKILEESDRQTATIDKADEGVLPSTLQSEKILDDEMMEKTAVEVADAIPADTDSLDKPEPASSLDTLAETDSSTADAPTAKPVASVAQEELTVEPTLVSPEILLVEDLPKIEDVETEVDATKEIPVDIEPKSIAEAAKVEADTITVEFQSDVAEKSVLPATGDLASAHAVDNSATEDVTQEAIPESQPREDEFTPVQPAVADPESAHLESIQSLPDELVVVKPAVETSQHVETREITPLLIDDTRVTNNLRSIPEMENVSLPKLSEEIATVITSIDISPKEEPHMSNDVISASVDEESDANVIDSEPIVNDKENLTVEDELAGEADVPSLQEPSVEESPYIEELPVKEVIIEQPDVDELAVETVSIRESLHSEYSAAEPVVEASSSEEPSVDKVAVDNSAFDEPTLEEPVVEIHTTGKQSAEELPIKVTTIEHEAPETLSVAVALEQVPFANLPGSKEIVDPESVPLPPAVAQVDESPETTISETICIAEPKEEPIAEGTPKVQQSEPEPIEASFVTASPPEKASEEPAAFDTAEKGEASIPTEPPETSIEDVAKQSLETVSSPTTNEAEERVSDVEEAENNEAVLSTPEMDNSAAVDESPSTESVDTTQVAGAILAAGGLIAIAGASIKILAHDSSESIETVEPVGGTHQVSETRELLISPEPTVETVVTKSEPVTAVSGETLEESEIGCLSNAETVSEVPIVHHDIIEASSEAGQEETETPVSDSLSDDYVLVESDPAQDIEHAESPAIEEHVLVEQSVVSLEDTITSAKPATQMEVPAAEGGILAVEPSLVDVSDAAHSALTEEPVVVESSDSLTVNKATQNEDEIIQVPSPRHEAPSDTQVSQEQAIVSEESLVHQTVLDISEPTHEATEPVVELSIPEHAVIDREVEAAPAPDDTVISVVEPELSKAVLPEPTLAPEEVPVSDAPVSVGDASVFDTSIWDVTSPQKHSEDVSLDRSGEMLVEQVSVLDPVLENTLEPIVHDAETCAQPEVTPSQSPTRSPILSATGTDGIVSSQVTRAFSASKNRAIEASGTAVEPEVVLSDQDAFNSSTTPEEVAASHDPQPKTQVVAEPVVAEPSLTEPETIPQANSLECESLPEQEASANEKVPAQTSAPSVEDVPTKSEAVESPPAESVPVEEPKVPTIEPLTRDLPLLADQKATITSEQDAPADKDSHAKEIAIGAGVAGALGLAAVAAAHGFPSKETELPKTIELLEEYAAKLDASEDHITLKQTRQRSVNGHTKSASIESSQVVDETVPLSDSFHVVERDALAREEAAASTNNKEASSEYGEESVARSVVRGGTQTDDASPIPRPPSTSRLFPRGIDTEFRVPTPAVILPDLDDPVAKQMSRVRSIRRQRRNTIKQAEEMVAAAVVIYATAEVLSPPASPTLASPRADISGSTEKYSSREAKGKGKDVEPPVLPTGEGGGRGRTRSRDFGAELEGELLGPVADLSVDDKGKATDTRAIKTDSPKRSSHHSSRHRSHRESRDGSKESSRRSHRHRSDSHTSVRSANDGTEPPRTPNRQDSGPAERSRRHRTPEEQAAHDKRKEERRRQRDLERIKDSIPSSPSKKDSAPSSPSKERSVPKATSESRERSEHHRHHSSRRHSRTSVEPKTEASSPAASKKFFDIKGQSVIEPNFALKSDEAPVASSSKPELKRSSTTRSTRLRKSNREDTPSKTKESVASAAKTRETRESVASAAKTKESVSSGSKTKESVTSVGGSSTSGDGEAHARRERRQEKRREAKEREEKEKKSGIRAAIKRFFTS